jgi:hypothetical protein
MEEDHSWKRLVLDSSLEIFDLRGDIPLHTGKSISFDRPVTAKGSFEQLKIQHQVDSETCTFVVTLSFDGNLTDLFAISENGFSEINGMPPESYAYYQSQQAHKAPPTLSEQRQIRALYRRLKKLLPTRNFSDIDAMEEMVIGASAVNTNFSRCSNCNLPMYVENKEDHRCFRCMKENLCSYCMTSHACTG